MESEKPVTKDYPFMKIVAERKKTTKSDPQKEFDELMA